MKRKFEELRENLDEFTQQSDYSLLLLGCKPEEALYAAQFLGGLDAAHPEDYFLTFVEPFERPGAYLDALVKSLVEQLREANELRTARGEPPLPEPPVELRDGRVPPEARLSRLLRFLPRLLPREPGHAVVVSFLPSANRDLDAYCRLMESILPEREAPRWMASLRIIISDDRDARRLVTRQRALGVATALSYEVDFSTPALTDALGREAQDPSLPMAQRMVALLQLAALDFSYRRYADAADKYGVLYQHFRERQQPAMAVLCLQGLGDAQHAAGDAAAAKRTLQSGLALALQHRALIPLLHALLSITGVCSTLEHHEDAESYAASGVLAARAALNAPLYVAFLEKQAGAQRLRGEPALALETYRRCVELCATYEQFSVWESALGALGALYREARMTSEAQAVERELARVHELEARRAAGESACGTAHAGDPAVGAPGAPPFGAAA